ncbi:unnamed protein product [Thlaspi arvense]|uniref:GRF-type domain-containing protein n=1 Tax=Thlaspi arvense TaxID=13288 RepID=A0AAU9SLY2_THLAR|nr:unnamed protein product [Thlaspi arvense]
MKKIERRSDRETTFSLLRLSRGLYTAALEGSKSDQWQLSSLNPASKSRSGFQDVSANSNPAGNYGLKTGEQDFPEKNCPYGVGLSLILTSNTQKNPGRRFYKCPIGEVVSSNGATLFQSALLQRILSICLSWET